MSKQSIKAFVKRKTTCLGDGWEDLICNRTKKKAISGWQLMEDAPPVSSFGPENQLLLRTLPPGISV
jgi:hypothetical protein